MEIHAVKTWYDRRHGVVNVDDHVTGVVREIKEIGDGRISVFFNEQSGDFDLVEHCLDGTDRLIFSVKELDGRVPDRLRRADHWGADTPERGMSRPEGSDFLDEMDRDQEAFQEEYYMKPLREKMFNALEEHGWAMDVQRGVGGQILVKKDISGRADSRGLPK